MPIKNCLDCGKEFYTPTTSVRCVECRAIHKKKVTKACNERNTASWMQDPKNRERKNQRDREHHRNNREWYREYQRNYYQTKLKKKRMLASLNQTEIEVDGNKIVLYECPRIGVKASNLPCGERWECFHNGKCPLVPKGKEEITFKDAVVSARIRPL